MRKALLAGAVILCAPLLYNVDAITGRWKFDRLCKEEGGSRFYGAVKQDVGWEVLAHDAYAYQSPFSFGHVAFVRFQNKDGARFDVRSEGYKGPNQRNYIFLPVDESQSVRYRFLYSNTLFPNDDRFAKTMYQVVDVASGALLAQHIAFAYQWAKPERMLLGMPTAIGCWNLLADGDRFFNSVYQIKEKQ